MYISSKTKRVLLRKTVPTRFLFFKTGANIGLFMKKKPAHVLKKFTCTYPFLVIIIIYFIILIYNTIPTSHYCTFF